MAQHPQVRLLAATVPLLNALSDNRPLFAELVGSPVPDGWPEFPEAVGFTLEQLRALVEYAAASGHVDHVVAHTLHGSNPSTGVLGSLVSCNRSSLSFAGIQVDELQGGGGAGSSATSDDDNAADRRLSPSKRKKTSVTRH